MDGDLGAQIDQVVVATTVVELSDEARIRFIDDVARGIFEYAEIARRYSMTMEQLYAECRRPEVLKAIKERRAIWNSDASIQERLRALYGVGMIEAAPSVLQMLTDPTVSNQVKIDLVKTSARIAGVDMSVNGRDGNVGAAPGSSFSVNITFNGANRVEKISTAVETPSPPPMIDGEAA